MPENYWNKNEKVLGVLGLSPYATIDFLRKVADVTSGKKDWEHIRIKMDLNTKIPSRGRALDYGEEDPTLYIKNSISDLVKRGADIIAIPCNTAQYFYSGFIKNINIPVLNIIEETSKYMMNQYPKICKVGVICSENTRKHKLYNKYTQNYGIEIISHENQNEVKEIIEKVKIGNDGDVTKSQANNITENLIRNGAEGIILGCTELPCVINEKYYNVPVFDSNKILAISCIDRIKGQKNA